MKNIRLIINIIDYVDTIEVMVNGEVVTDKKVSILSNAKYECFVNDGINDINIIKKSEISQQNWKKIVFCDWISCIMGVPNWTLAEKTLDSKRYSISFKVNVKNDMTVDIKLNNKSGFEIINNLEYIKECVKQIEQCDDAKKRVKRLYSIPLLLMALTIECFLLTIFGMLFIKGFYLKSIIILLLAILWIVVIVKNKA